MKKICEYCKNEFETKKEDRTCCSRSHSAKLRWSNPEFKKHMQEKTKNQWQNAEYREKMIKSNTERWNDDEFREKLSDKFKELWTDPLYRNKTITNLRHSCQTPEHRKKLSEKVQQTHTTYEFSAKMSAIATERWNDDTFKEKMHDIFNTVEHKEKMSAIGIERWKNPEYAECEFKKRLTYKDYIMPSGIVVKLQGYEPRVLTDLLNTYDESDLVIGVKNINNTIGKIHYTFENQNHAYYPDFYIKPTNTIVEVKSVYTFNMHKEKNLAKEHACLQQGFNFMFIII